MEYNEAIRHCADILRDAGLEDQEIGSSNFLDYSNLVRDALKEWPKERKENTPWLRDFAVALKKLRDDFLTIVEADPMVLYKPAHDVALEFHKSPALIRYFRGGNRISKTQSGVADNYWLLTHQHPYRPHSPWPVSGFIIGVNFTKYGTQVFSKKYIQGEGGNPLSPAFPVGGKWFYHFDERRKIISIACPECAHAGKAGECKHPKSTLVLFSDTEGPDVLQGGQYGVGQFDEHIRENFFGEALKRLETVPNSGLTVTGTPLHGKAAWEHQRLTRTFQAGPPKNLIPETDIPLISLHTIDQFNAGLVAHERIKASMLTMTDPEIEARVYGRPAAFSDSAVFDLQVLHDFTDAASKATRYNLLIDCEPEELVEESIIRTEEDIGGLTRIWEPPKKHEQYIIGADVAQGLTNRDASCGTVLKMIRDGMDIRFEMVAQMHGWINSLSYAAELVKLSILYNSAILVIERRGPGDATIQRCKEIGYWNMFRDVNAPAAFNPGNSPVFGLDTNVSTKGLMISCLQKVIRDRVRNKTTITIPCLETLEELGSYGQDMTDAGNVRFRGESGMHDDRVMSLVLAVYAAKIFPVFDIEQDTIAREADKAPDQKVSNFDKSIWSEIRAEVEGELLS